MHPSCRRRAFSLLEMMIVLVVMVGVLAIVWPNLQRPFRKAGLSEATQKLRQAIDDGRYQAMTTGTPVFIQIRQGGHEVRSVGLDSLVADESGDLQVNMPSEGEPVRSPATPQQLLNPNGPSDDSLHAVTPRIWKLPDHVVISSVQWEHSDDADSDELSVSDFDDNHSLQSPSGGAREGAGNAQRAMSHDADRNAHGDEPLALADGTEEQWWLPLTAMGHGRDAEITLWDTQAHESMRVSFTASTGELEIIR
jgi:prepilin-type N-terminal cleavage/methylation domain-containing protein